MTIEIVKMAARSRQNKLCLVSTITYSSYRGREEGCPFYKKHFEVIHTSHFCCTSSKWHKNCISSYVSKAKLNVIRKRKSENGTAEKENPLTKILRSGTPIFKQNCIVCGHLCDEKHKTRKRGGGGVFYKVRTLVKGERYL